MLVIARSRPTSDLTLRYMYWYGHLAYARHFITTVFAADLDKSIVVCEKFADAACANNPIVFSFIDSYCAGRGAGQNTIIFIRITIFDTDRMYQEVAHQFLRQNKSAAPCYHLRAAIQAFACRVDMNLVNVKVIAGLTKMARSASRKQQRQY
jgi:hypothetical protein